MYFLNLETINKIKSYIIFKSICSAHLLRVGLFWYFSRPHGQILELAAS